MRILGVDTLEFGIDIENYDESFSSLLSEIDRLKIEAQTEYKLKTIEINGMKFNVNKKGQGFYSYKIECEQFYICFMSHSISKNPPIFVRFMSEFLWEYGCYKSLIKFMDWFKQLNIKIIGTRSSRLDIALDIDEIEFLKNDVDNFIKRANKIARHYVDDDYYVNKEFAGLTVGRGR